MRNEAFSYVSPLGAITYHWDGMACRRVYLGSVPSRAEHRDPVSDWMDAYFAGSEHPMPPLAAPRSRFQAALRTALLAIPRGQTRRYGELAATLGSAPRAVGQALGANPLPLLIPCHRVVSVAGIGGFSAGLDWKKRLLAFERGAA